MSESGKKKKKNKRRRSAGLAAKLRKKLRPASQSLVSLPKNLPTPDFHQPLDVKKDDGMDLHLMQRITAEHVSMCRRLGIQNPKKTHSYRVLEAHRVVKPRSWIDDNGKRQKTTGHQPASELRLTTFDGRTYKFPFRVWPQVFEAYAMDMKENNLLFYNTYAHDQEGIRMFFEIDYRKLTEPSTETMLHHARLCQDVVREYYAKNQEADFSMWVMLCKAKPKLVKDRLDPIVAKGCHIVFPHIVVNCEKGSQICLSANLRLERDCGTANLVDCCFKTSVANLRPIMSRKLDDCPECMNLDDFRSNCEMCYGRGRVGSGSFYTVSYLIDSDGRSTFPDVSALQQYVSGNLTKIVRDTSLVPERVNDFTRGYKKPAQEPDWIPPKLRSKNKDDRKKGCVYTKDRAVLSKLKTRLVPLRNDNVLDMILDVIKGYHRNFNTENLMLDRDNTCMNSKTIFVNIRGCSAQNFCQIADAKGHFHKSNRVSFRLYRSKSEGFIAQHCYDPDCIKLRAEKDVQERLKKPIHCMLANKIFTVLPKPKRKKLPVSSSKTTTSQRLQDFIDSMK